MFWQHTFSQRIHNVNGKGHLLHFYRDKFMFFVYGIQEVDNYYNYKNAICISQKIEVTGNAPNRVGSYNQPFLLTIYTDYV